MPIIKFKNFSFRFSNLKEPTLKDINLEIKKGEKILIAGASGSGKSTLMHCINGIIPFAHPGEISGKLEVAGLIPSESHLFEISQKAGTILQDQDSQFIGLTVGEDVAFALENNNVSHQLIIKEVNDSLSAVGMTDFIEHSPYELSGGQKQSVSLAGILSSHTDILLFDEPLANLDPASASKVIELIDILHKKYKKTIVIIEHRIEDVLEHHIDKLIVVNRGEIIANDTPDKVLKQDILRKYGLREPLYIEAMKHFNINIKNIENVHNIESCVTDDIIKKITANLQIPQAGNIISDSIADKPLLSLKNIDFTYKGSKRKILKNISFTVNKGEVISILGNNGAGKSTLSNIITGIKRPTSGAVYLSGDNLSKKSIKDIGAKIGYVMQNPNHMLVKNMIKEEVCLGLHAFNKPIEFIEEKYMNTIKTCGLYGYRNWPVSSLSYGQRKRVTIASILALDPKIIILDEPTAGQDYKTYTDFMDFIKAVSQTGITIIIITHDMHLALEYTDRSIVLSSGEIIGDDKPSKILSNKEIVEKANLKITSLGRLSDAIGLDSRENFIQTFINIEKGNREVE